MSDRIRPLAYHLFVALMVGGLWVLADARRRMDDGTAVYLRAPDAGMRLADASGDAADEPPAAFRLLSPRPDRDARRTEVVGPDLLDEISR